MSETRQAPTVRPAADADAAAWDAFVAAHPEGSFFHRFGWRGVHERALGHRARYLLAERDDGSLAGVLPLVHLRSRLFGDALVSLPFATYAGALAHDAATLRALDEAAEALARELAVGSLEYRLRRPSGRGRPTKDLYACFHKPIHGSPEENLQAIRSKQRNIVRKGTKAGLEAGPSSLAEFYPVYSESVRNLGTPVFPKRLFRAIAEAFPADTEYLSARQEGAAVSSAMLFYHGDTVCPYYWGGRYAARAVAGNDFLAFAIMNRAAARGCTRFDFGRSKADTGAWQWKRNLGFEAEPLHYEYVLVRDKEMPAVNPTNPKYRLFINAWKRLPLPVAELLGPMVSRSLG